MASLIHLNWIVVSNFSLCPTSQIPLTMIIITNKCIPDIKHGISLMWNSCHHLGRDAVTSCD